MCESPKQPLSEAKMINNNYNVYDVHKYRVFRAQADWTLTHRSHKDTEQSTIDCVTLTDSLIR
jgi:hypothetical protein